MLPKYPAYQFRHNNPGGERRNRNEIVGGLEEIHLCQVQSQQDNITGLGIGKYMPDVYKRQRLVLKTPFDLHVLGAPPAFVLSQDQTLKNMVFKEHFCPFKSYP